MTEIANSRQTFKVAFLKKMHIFLMFEANENFLLEMQIFLVLRRRSLAL